MSRPTLVAFAAIVVFVLAAGGYWVHGAWQKRVEQHQVTEALRSTTEQLRRALAAGASTSLVARIDENLVQARAPRNPQLAEAAEVYIIGAREIARRRVEIERLERQAAADRAALEAHMARGGRRRGEAWFGGAMVLKKRVENDHYELGLRLKALDELLSSLPEAERTLAPHVEPAALLDETERQQAHRQTELEAKRASAALERVRALVLP